MSAEERSHREHKRVRVLSFFMLIILLGSTAGFAFISYEQDRPPEAVTEGVEDTGNGWLLHWQGETFSLRASPSAVADVPVETSVTLQDYAGAVLYVDAESEAIVTELDSTLGRYTNRFQPACYGSCERDLPELNCTSNLIVWNPSDENSVRQEEQCVFIDGDIRAVDAFIYRTFGVQ